MVFLNKVKILSEAIPSTLKQFVLVGMYVLGTSMVKGIRRNEFNSCLKKCNTRLRPFIGATIKQMENYVKPIIQGDTPDVVILHIGCNGISNKNMPANDIAEGDIVRSIMLIMLLYLH